MNLTLRSRLLLALTGLLMLGIVIADIASVTALRSYLLDEVDRELSEARGPATRRLDLGGRRDPGVSEYYLEVRDSDGDVLVRINPSLRGDIPSAPALDAREVLANAGGRPFTVRAADGNEDFRVIVGVSQDGSYAVAIATPLSDVDRAVERLVTVEIIVTSVLLIVLVAAGYAIIRRDLQPLEDMVDTAGAIAGGDLSRRVERADDTTEVGRLGAALNNMLGRIQESFEQTKKSEERLRRFAADASHELRTPLTAIRGYAEMYRAGAVQDDEHMARVMGRIEREAARMGTLVEDLLTLARLDQGRPLERERVDLNDLVANAVHDAAAAADTHPIDLVSANSSVPVDVDAGRIHQVLANLVTNAQVHTPAGTNITVKVATDGSDAVVSVADRGPGIEPEVLTQVFERFFRADSGRARSEGGTGLGLAIVQALAQAHGGTVSVRSTVGEGTTFTVRLPLAV